ncbi:MAG: hypothetical protein LKG79_07570 [Furfurilactobacillus sp.]|jgi:hypothetical protein|uniref:hypothetical protein n=1 Tax=Furfurilactobacillus sp. TaxID=2767911 RepID=UPI0025850A0F|nr:hypothetical protein [Furfurilactobacillus sp.]MCH4010605.1 hypothetical protein [Furfurilactobacillus sp.]MCH4036497.1 hypothetical protein [Furfurilactobacillus sp.]MCH4114557.1 hypothetical protein [Furfurilactobacillus sp.]MCH4133824.1 hypothetical protein [Furfurilactobacillus sp.]MCI1340139.1 hypothetical protein [Furfurilactobacillus sp.]
MKLAAYDEFGTLQGVFDFEENYKINTGENLTHVLPDDDQHTHFDKESNTWIVPTKQPTLASAMVMLGQVVAENAALKSENTTLQKSQSATDMKAQQALTLAGSLVAQMAAMNKTTTGGTE